MNTVFVYGTLRGHDTRRGLGRVSGDQAQFVTQAVTIQAGFTMWDLGPFPGVTLTPGYRIQGEVWHVDDRLMKELDIMEGYPDFYNRILVETTSGTAWMYYLTPEVLEEFRFREKITSRDFIVSWQEAPQHAH